jgi:hypothetical protein
MKRTSFLRDTDLDGIDAGIGLLLTEYRALSSEY